MGPSHAKRIPNDAQKQKVGGPLQVLFRETFVNVCLTRFLELEFIIFYQQKERTYGQTNQRRTKTKPRPTFFFDMVFNNFCL